MPLRLGYHSAFESLQSEHNEYRSTVLTVLASHRQPVHPSLPPHTTNILEHSVALNPQQQQ